MLDEIYDYAKEHMQKALEVLKKDYTTIRSGKVSTAILDNVTVEYYGNPTPLNQVATVLATDATTIIITPWEKSLVNDIEKAIQIANIGVNPNNDGDSVKLFFPPMTVEQRQEFAKKAKAMTENAKVAIRNVRKHANDKVKKLLKSKEITEDENKKALDNIQKITDEFVGRAEEMFKKKEAEILKV